MTSASTPEQPHATAEPAKAPLAPFSEAESAVWIGLLETHKRLTRALNAELEAEHGLNISALELLGRLAAAEHAVLRLTDLADRAGLSLSRVSRIIDNLEDRGLVERRRCPEDRRARNAGLTAAGAELLEAAQSTHLAGVQARFFEHLAPSEMAALASVFGRMAPGAVSACS
jgi:DNA-binding MarR family transcriptional regulator